MWQRLMDHVGVSLWNSFYSTRERESLPVSGEAVKAAAENTGQFGYKTMEVLLQHRGGSLPVSDEVVKAAAGNTGEYGHKIIEVLLQHQGKSLPITDEVVKIAVEPSHSPRE